MLDTKISQRSPNDTFIVRPPVQFFCYRDNKNGAITGIECLAVHQAI
jgi:hypothetical protein